MRVLFAGTPEAAVPSLDAIVAAGHEVVGVLTRPDAPQGRGRTLHPSPVGARASELGIPTLTPRSLRDADALDAIGALEPDVCPIVAYGNLVPAEILAIPTYGWVNLHFSLLPAWRGAAPVQRAMMAGDSELGVTTFRLVPELDAGPIFRQGVANVPNDATAGETLDALAHFGAAMLVDTLADLAAGVEPTPQPSDDTTYAAKITVDDAHLDWNLPAVRLHRLILGTSPAPGAWTTLAGERFKVLRSRVADQAGSLEPGEIEIERKRVLVGTGTTPLELVDVQPPGKRHMRATDWARGARIEPGQRFA